MQITASLVKELREKTGVGMMDCKKALTETGGDFAAAEKFLREKGLAAASKKAERETSEGSAFIASNGSEAVILEINCETDFVANNEQFQALGNQIAQEILKSSASSINDLDAISIQGKPLQETLSDYVLKLGENLTLKRLDRVSAPAISSYVHMNGKIGVIVSFTGKIDEDLGRDIAMHVAAANPEFLDSSAISADRINEERSILKTQMLNEGKPDNIVDKIVDGKISKFYKENCLLDQAFVKDPDKSIKSILPSGVAIQSYLRYQI